MAFLQSDAKMLAGAVRPAGAFNAAPRASPSRLRPRAQPGDPGLPGLLSG